ncbi:YbbR-like domain-containing protein [Winogradskyella eckloniae]|uniref:YbbR-like domain-containing protein n=1 Tax=Winogradskyella eckloniae TaxID=1089306 RepID=UPI001566028A|nr:YbbR-like domain-containing protein [Winogradskyella eckloniae]NRD21157.1 YbbR-like domain-containing protein [Winogradskyella eckloniae]
MRSRNNISILDYFKKRNYKRFSLFFIAAFILLIFSKLSSDYKQTIKLKVKLVNLEDEVIIENDTSNYIEAYVEAKGFSLLPLVFNDSKELIVNSNSNISTKGRSYIFDVQKHKFLIEGQLGSSFKLLSVLPDTVYISYSKSASKLVPVTLIEHINYAVGYDLKDDFELSIDSVKVVGSSVLLDSITKISTTDVILNKVKNDINKTVKLDVSKFENIEVYPETVHIKGKVSRFTEGIMVIPVEIINQPNDVTINYFPKTVSVSFYVDLENYNSVKTEYFSVVCNFADLVHNQDFLMPKVVKKPSSVKHVNIKQKRIDFIKL